MRAAAAMAGDGLSERATRVAGYAAALGDPEWADEAGALAGRGAPRPTAMPSYRDLAVAGVALVRDLADADRWSDAERQADRLRRYFRGARRDLHAVAAEAFDGLRAAAWSRDRQELEDFADLVGEIFARG